MRQYTIVDLFCGAGGLGLGLTRAGFELVGAYDHSAAAVRTHNANLGHRADLAQVGHETRLPDTDIIVGGPPCQGFSSAGMRRAGDCRNSLVSCFAQLVARHRPAAFVFENVEGFLTAEHGARVLELLVPLVDAGYRIHMRKINAANYGVPQHRKRVLAIGGLGWDPTYPAPTHRAHGAPGADLTGRHLPPCPTVGNALEGLSPVTNTPPGEPQGHFVRPLDGLDLERAAALGQGQTMRDLPQALHHKSYNRRAFRRVMDGTPSERRGGAPAGLRRLRADQPSKAITGGAKSEFLHPSENRPLSIRECARLQTFPDDFVFMGTAAEQSQLIGNAVPPHLAYLVGESLLSGLHRASFSDREGALLSFVPTASHGASPALRFVTELVRSRMAGRIAAEEMSLWD